MSYTCQIPAAAWYASIAAPVCSTPQQLLLCTSPPLLQLLLPRLYCYFCPAAVVEGWLDLAKLVASEGSKAKSPYEELAYQIGALQPCCNPEVLLATSC
jgi:hypothetical protein